MALANRIAKPKAATPKPEAKSAAARAAPRQALPFGAMLQTKLALGPVNDVFERQADSAASHVVANRPGMPILSSVPMGAGMAQRACAACDEQQKSKPIQRKCACGAGADAPCSCNKEEEHPELQIDRASKGPQDGSSGAIGAVQSVVSGAGKPLSKPVRQDMEKGFGRSFSHVRIHDTPRAAASAEGIGAHAYTVGNNIAFNRGQYQPSTDNGRFLLAHELAHTVQQAGAPRAENTRISQPGDRHETQANRAASAVTSGAPMPALSPGGAVVARYSFDEFLDDAGSVGSAIADVPGDILDVGSDVVDVVAGVASGVKDAIYGIANAIGSAVSWDGTTAVIDIPEFNPCPEIDFQMQLSDLGLDPTLYFPVVAGALGIGIVEVVGVLGAEVNLDPGFGFQLAGCNFGPGQIRIDALSFSPSVSVAGQLSVKGSSMFSLGGDIGVSGDLFAIIAWPDPPFVIMVPLVGLSLGGTYQLMAQIGGEISGKTSANLGLGGVSAANLLSGDIGVGLDMSYGLYGSLSVLGADMCRVGWPLDTHHWDAAASFDLATMISVGSSGIGFSFDLSARAMETNPLEDLGFAFDESRLEDDCPICDFLTDNGLMPGQNNINWANPAYQAKLPRLGGPKRNVMQRDPGITSTAKCRGTCGVDCPEGTCDEPRNLIMCTKRGEGHVWHTYENYATCGTHQGCKDHDACYDAAAEMPIWGFGGYMVGPMYRVCDLEALCGYSFQQAVTWAGGGGPYQEPRLRYADKRVEEPGCLGPCPRAEENEEGETVQQTCIPDKTIWEGIDNSWELFNGQLGRGRVYQGFTPLPYIGGVHYGVDAEARGQAVADATLGPLDMVGVCLIYDPATQVYTGHASMVLGVDGGIAASITGELSGFLSDVLCLMKEVEIVGSMTFGATIGFPTSLTFAIDLFCHKGKLQILPTASIETCIDIMGELTAALDFYLFGFHALHKDWPLFEQELQKCWTISYSFDPFIVGEAPNFNIVSQAFDIFGSIMELFGDVQPNERKRRPPTDPLEGRRTWFPCLDGDDDDDDDGTDDGGPVTCSTKATGAQGIRLHPHELEPTQGPTTTISIPGPGGLSDTVASWMEAKYLAYPHRNGEKTNRTVQKFIYHHRGMPMRGCFENENGKKGAGHKEDQVFVKGHLLNNKLGGLATNDNLYPITQKANRIHESSVEKGVKDRVNRADGDLMYYKVTVAAASGPTEITNPTTGVGAGFYKMDATFHCEVADYQYCDNDTVRRNPVVTTDIRESFVFNTGDQAFDERVKPPYCQRP